MSSGGDADPLRSWQGQGQPAFRHLKESFAESYAFTVRRHGKKRFVVIYGAKGPALARTFAEFDADVRKARGLIRPERDVAAVLGLAERNSYEFLVFACAAWLEGFTLCPLNPDEGAERIHAKLSSLGEPCSLWAAGDSAKALGARALALPAAEWEGALPDRAFLPAQPMTIVFTSGSTGYSKAVEQMESGILSNVDALITRHGLEKPACIGTPLPLFHVNALEFSFLCTLLSGSPLVLFTSFSPDGALAAAHAEGIEILSLIPSMVRALCERGTRIAPPPLLRYVVTAAAPLPPSVAKAFLAAFPFRLLQGYGLSEAVNFSALMPPGLDDAEYRRWMTGYDRPSIGPALDGNEILVVGEDGRELGPGERGEICVRGFNVMKGYRHDDGKVCFRGGYLRTGDLGQFELSPRGEKFFFLNGRLKDTIKRHGETLSLVETDDYLALWKGAGDAIAVPFEHRLAGEELGVVLSAPARDGAALLSLRTHLEKLPAPLRPTAILWTPDPTRTPSGKPLRWRHSAAFAFYADKVLGPGIVIGGED